MTNYFHSGFDELTLLCVININKIKLNRIVCTKGRDCF